MRVSDSKKFQKRPVTRFRFFFPAKKSAGGEDFRNRTMRCELSTNSHEPLQGGGEQTMPRGAAPVNYSNRKRTPTVRHRPRRLRSARLAQEAEGAGGRLNNQMNTNGPPRGGLSVFQVSITDRAARPLAPLTRVKSAGSNRACNGAMSFTFSPVKLVSPPRNRANCRSAARFFLTCFHRNMRRLRALLRIEDLHRPSTSC